MLTLAGISFAYPGTSSPALAPLNLTIPAGGVFGLLGPNGAGKTTLISILSGLLASPTGEIRLDGRPLSDVRADNAAAVALVPQDYAFYPMLSVAENLCFFGGMLGLKGALLTSRCDEAIAFARLEQVTGKRAEQLSGGLRRRLNLAIGLLGHPQVLLLDEPTVGVDPQSRSFLLESVAALPAQGTTVIYTSHYMEEVEAICSRVAILDQGLILAEGPLSELLDVDNALLELELTGPLPETLAQEYAATDLGHFKFRLILPSTVALPRLLDALHAAGCTVRHLNLGRQNLEQLFMRLTRRSLRD